MRELNFDITFHNHTFKIRISPRTTLCFYEISDKYTTSIIFAENTYASVKYKDIRFSGSITKRNIWSVDHNFRPVVRKYYDHYYFKSATTAPVEQEDAPIAALIECSEVALFLYNQLINGFPEFYSRIENKEEFKQQLCEHLDSSYGDYCDLDEVVEYENWDDVVPDEDPIIEQRTKRSILFSECAQFFVSFLQSELDSINQKSIFTLKNIINETPELHSVPRKFLRKEFDRLRNKCSGDFIMHDIWYQRSGVVYKIGCEIYESYRYDVFMNIFGAKIVNTLSSMDIAGVSKDEIRSLFNTEFSKDTLLSGDEPESRILKFADDYAAFCHLYNKVTSLFNSNNIELNWDDDAIRLFQKYDEEGTCDDSCRLAEYEAYKCIIPYYRKRFFKKNSTKYKPTIEQLPAFTAFGTRVLDILFKHKVLIDEDDHVIYNENGDSQSAYEEIIGIELQ